MVPPVSQDAGMTIPVMDVKSVAMPGILQIPGQQMMIQ
jgi:hypothetical protein